MIKQSVSAWMGFALLLSSASVKAQDEWPGTERGCSGDECRAVPTVAEAERAMDEIRAQGQSSGDASSTSGLSEETWVALGAAAATGAGITYGVGRYAAYRAEIRAAAEAATILKRETIRMTRALSAALAPELERFGNALLQANRTRAASGAAALTSAEVETALSNGLRSPEVRARILERLRGSIGTLAETAYDKFITSRAAGTMAREFMNVARLSAAGAGSLVERQLGVRLGATLVESLAPGLARYSVRAAAAAAGTAAATGGFLARCLGRLGRVAGNPILLALMIVLEPSPTAAGTMDAFYAEHPEDLFLERDDRARRWLRYGNVRTSVVLARDIMREAGELSANSSRAPASEESMLPQECRAEEPEVHYDESAGTCGG